MSEQDYKKLCLARDIVRKKIADQLLPSVIRHNEKDKKNPKFDTWRDWWRDRYGGSLSAYIKQQQAIKQREG